MSKLVPHIITYQITKTNNLIDYRIDIDPKDNKLFCEYPIPKFLNGIGHHIVSIRTTKEFELELMSTIDQEENGVNNQFFMEEDPFWNKYNF